MKRTLVNFNLEGIDYFWKILEKLESNKTPTEEERDNLFATTGYKALLMHEFSKDFFKDNFRKAFMPSMSTELKAALEYRPDRPYLEHYIRVLKLKDLISKHLEIMDYIRVSEKAIEAARQYLPSIAMSTIVEVPSVTFIIFMNDARGGYGPVILDALASMEWGDISLFLGHEFHHFYRNRLPFALNFIESDSVEGSLVNVLISVESEGVADLINMNQRDTSEPWIQKKERYERQVKLVPDSIRFLDEWIIRNSQSLSEVDREECEAIASNITDSGHQMGYYMAKAILEHFPLSKLVETVGNPFAFVKLYQDAATRTPGLPCLSGQSLDILLNLEPKYSKQKNRLS